jgi:hypothetical protein
MIITKVRVKPDKAISSQTFSSAETSNSGIRVSVDDIRVRAFHMYQQRGSKHGHDIQDWLKAERQITQR